MLKICKYNQNRSNIFNIACMNNFYFYWEGNLFFYPLILKIRVLIGKEEHPLLITPQGGIS